MNDIRALAHGVADTSAIAAFEDIVGELADALDVSAVFVAVFADDARSALRTLAVWLDGKSLRNFDYPLAGSPCAEVVGHEFRFVARGVAREFQPGTLFAAKGMDSYAAYPLNDSAGAPWPTRRWYASWARRISRPSVHACCWWKTKPWWPPTWPSCWGAGGSRSR